MSVASVRYGYRSAPSLPPDAKPCGLGRARLARRMRAREGVVLHAGIYDAAHGRERRQVVLVEIGTRSLARQADVGDGDGVAVAVAAGLLGPREIGFQRLERSAEPVLDPFEPRRLIEVELVLEIFAYPRHQ